MIFPLVVAGLGGWFGVNEFKKWRAYTPERKAMFEKAMNSPMDPGQLRAMADSFERDGLKKQAIALRKRASLREAPDSVKAKRREVFKKAMQSTDPRAIESVAKAHEEIGAVGAASALKIQAETLRAVQGAK